MKFNINKFKEGEQVIYFNTGNQYKELIILMDRLYSLKPTLDRLNESINYLNNNKGDRILCYHKKNIIGWRIKNSNTKETISYEDFINTAFSELNKCTEVPPHIHTANTNNLHSLIETLENKIEELDNATKEAKQLLKKLKEIVGWSHPTPFITPHSSTLIQNFSQIRIQKS